MSPIKLNLQKRFRSETIKIEKFSFLLGGVILLISAYNRYDSGKPNSQLFETIYYSAYIIGGVSNIAAGILYSIIPENKKDKIGKWLQIIIAVLLLFDAIDKLIKGKVALPVALIFASLLYFIVAIFSHRLKGRRFIVIDDEKVLYRKSLFKIHRLNLDEIKEITITPEKIILLLLNNKTLTMYPGNNDITQLNAFIDKTNSINNIQAGRTF